MKAAIFQLDKEIRILCVTASSFPNGVMGAFETLTQKLPSMSGRTNYGISRLDKNGSIIYKAAVNELDPAEAQKFGCEPFTIRKGPYLYKIVKDFMKNHRAIGETFGQMLGDPRIDKEGYCVEIYFDAKDVRCMVTFDAAKI